MSLAGYSACPECGGSLDTGFNCTRCRWQRYGMSGRLRPTDNADPVKKLCDLIEESGAKVAFDRRNDCTLSPEKAREFAVEVLREKGYPSLADSLARVPEVVAPPLDLTGKYGICSRGRIGLIEGRKALPWGESWVGTGIDGTPWASREPKVICATDAALLPGVAGATEPSAWETIARDSQRELTEVRDAWRRFKLDILSALGVTAPWAITTESQKNIVERIERLRAHDEGADAERQRLLDYATELENTLDGGGRFFAPRDVQGFIIATRRIAAASPVPSDTPTDTERLHWIMANCDVWHASVDDLRIPVDDLATIDAEIMKQRSGLPHREEFTR